MSIRGPESRAQEGTMKRESDSTRGAARRRTFLAVLVGLFLVGGILLLFLIRRQGPVPEGGDGLAGRDASRPAPAGGAEGGAGEAGEGDAPDSGAEAEEAPPPDAGSPLLRGRVTGEGEGIARARVRLFSVREVEEAIDRLQGLIPQGTFPDISAIIRVVRSELDAIRRSGLAVTADSAGAYEVRRAKPGAYLVLAAAEGWLFRFGDVVSLAEGETRVLDVQLDRGASIAGRVITSSAAGVPGVRVVAEFRPFGVAGAGLIIRRLMRYVDGEFLRGPIEAVTAADGSFQLSSLPPGVYDLAAEKPGAPECRLKGVETGAGDALILMGKGGSARGVLRDAGGEAAEGVPVRLERQEDAVQLPLPMASMNGVADSINRLLGQGPLTARSGKEGQVRFGPLSPGAYRLAVEEPGFLPFQRTFDLGPDEDLDLGTLTVDRGEAIAGRVRSEDGAAIEGARVVASPASMNMFSMGGALNDLFSGRSATVTDPSGDFRLAGLPRGKFRITASRAGYAPAKKKDVRAGTDPVELVLRPGHRVAGKVVESGEDGKPIRGVKVAAAGVRAETDADGRFTLAGVVPESPDANPFVDLSDMPGMVPPVPAAPTVEVSASLPGYLDGKASAGLSAGDVEVEIALRKCPGIAGTVLDPDGQPAPGALVRLVPAMESRDLPPGLDFLDPGLIFIACGVSDGEGKFRLRDFRGADPDGSFQVIADHPLFARGITDEFPLAGDDEEAAEIEVRLSASARVKGTVTDGRSVVSGALVRLRKAPEKEDAGPDMNAMFLGMLGLPKGGDTTYTAGDGTFAFDRVLPGDHQVTAEKAGFAESPAQTFSLAAGETREVTIRVDPGGEIAGDVLDPRGSPIEGARVRLFVERGEEDKLEEKQLLEAQKLFGASYRSARVRGDGGFLLAGLPAGRYTLRAEGDGFIASELAGVSPGERKKLVLEPAAGVHGAVFDRASRSPITSFRVKVKKQGGRQVPDLEDMPFNQGREYNDAEGRFAREDLESGKLVVTVSARGYLPAEKTLLLRAGSLVEEEFLLAEAGRVSGTVRDLLTGRPVAGTRIGLSRARAEPREEGEPRREKPEGSEAEGEKDGEKGHAAPPSEAEDAGAMSEYFQDEWMGTERSVSAEDGSFLLEGIPPGPQAVVASHPEYIAETLEGIEVGPGKERAVTFSLRKGLSISGRVLDPAGAPAGGKMVFLREAGAGATRTRKSAITGEDGRYRLGGLAPGSYRLVLPRSMTVSTEKVEAHTREREEPRVIDLQADVEGIELRLPAGS